jgi:molybdopterin molybdotransferase
VTARIAHRAAAFEWEQARRTAYHAVRALGLETVGLAAATGRVTAESIIAGHDIPHYASSAMDGWVVSGEPPWELDAETGALPSRGARPVVTGGLIPERAEAVLRSEHGRVLAGLLQLEPGRHAPRPGADIRAAGQEAVAGEVLIEEGTLLNPGHIAVAAACARDTVLVRARPRAELLLTGDEVDAFGVPGPGRVRDSFGPTLPTLVSQLGGIVVASTRVPDRRDATLAALRSRPDGELVITTGGTGSSSSDHLRAALVGLGAQIIVPGIASRPGGPSLLARLPDGRLLVGLPGNPLAAVVGLLVLAAPALAGWGGRSLAELTRVVAARDIAGHPHRTMLVPYLAVDGGVVPSRWIGSSMMRGLADSAGIVAIPPRGLEAGQQGVALPLPWPRG